MMIQNLTGLQKAAEHFWCDFKVQGSRFLYLSHNKLYRVESEVKCKSNQVRSVDSAKE